MLFERVAIQNVRLPTTSGSDVHSACAAALAVQSLALHEQQLPATRMWCPVRMQSMKCITVVFLHVHMQTLGPCCDPETAAMQSKSGMEWRLPSVWYPRTCLCTHARM